MSAEVPFKDFLIFLYHSASSSPASTRVGSSTHETKTCLNDNNVQKHVVKSKPLVTRNLKSHQMMATVNDQKRESISNPVLPSSSGVVSQQSGKSIPQDSRQQQNSLIQHEVFSISNESESKKQTVNLHNKRRSSSQGSCNKTNSTSDKIKPRSSSSKSKCSIIDMKQREQVDNELSQNDSLRDDESSANNPTTITSNEIRQESSKMKRSGKGTYRELLGDYNCPYANNTQDSKIDNDVHIDFQYENPHHHHDHLHVHDKHDLSFYKNFSATTRSKSSLAYIYSKSTTADDNHHYFYHHHQQYNHDGNQKDNQYHQDIYFSLLSKRLSRSTPIQLDGITSIRNSEYSNPDEELLDNLYDYDNYETFSHSDEHCLNSPKSNNTSPAVTPPVTTSPLIVSKKSSSVNSMKNISIDNDEFKLEDSDVLLESSLLVTNSQSSQALNSMNNNTTFTSPPRRINTSNAVALVSRNKKSSSSSSSSNNRTTTVTVTMDTSSLFLDAVYVNLKQDVDRSTNIKLYY